MKPDIILYVQDFIYQAVFQSSPDFTIF
jgi:hypothetical protein